jgi:transcriptional regulator with XRE-family HTH domain
MERLAGFRRVAPRPSDPDPALGEVLRAERVRQGRSQEGLAHDAGLTTNALSRIELGQADPSFSTVTKIASALGLSRAELMRRVERER